MRGGINHGRWKLTRYVGISQNNIAFLKKHVLVVLSHATQSAVVMN